MNRDSMIDYIRLWYGSWDFFCKAIQLMDSNKIGIWFIYYEGIDPSDMSLCSENPCSDNLGEIITCKDCFG